MKKSIDFKYLLFSFFFVSIGAWIFELIYSLIFNHVFVLPGVLYGPWCPIYGVTYIILLLLINKNDKIDHNLFKIFFTAVLVEYIASYISSKIFGRTIWDYSDFILNINGRVCLQMSLLFTLVGYMMLYHIEPLLNKLYNKLGRKTEILDLEFLLLFILDAMLSIMSKK